MSESNQRSNTFSNTPKKLSSSFKFAESFESNQLITLWRSGLLLRKASDFDLGFSGNISLLLLVIGRDRYTAVSEFVIQQAAPLDGSSASVLAGAASSLKF